LEKTTIALRLSTPGQASHLHFIQFSDFYFRAFIARRVPNDSREKYTLASVAVNKNIIGIETSGGCKVLPG